MDWNEVDCNPFYSPDSEAAVPRAQDRSAVRRSGSSVGAVTEVVADGLSAGLGAPNDGKLDADIASALISIDAVKAVETGFAVASACGEENVGEMSVVDGKLHFHSSHAGGILGDISTGQPITARFAVKPTSLIIQPGLSIDREGNPIQVSTRGRHDPCVGIRCVGIRTVPVGEAMLVCVLADHLLRHRAQVPPSPHGVHPLVHHG